MASEKPRLSWQKRDDLQTDMHVLTSCQGFPHSPDMRPLLTMLPTREHGNRYLARRVEMGFRRKGTSFVRVD